VRTVQPRFIGLRIRGLEPGEDERVLATGLGTGAPADAENAQMEKKKRTGCIFYFYGEFVGPKLVTEGHSRRRGFVRLTFGGGGDGPPEAAPARKKIVGRGDPDRARRGQGAPPLRRPPTLFRLRRRWTRLTKARLGNKEINGSFPGDSAHATSIPGSGLFLFSFLGSLSLLGTGRHRAMQGNQAPGGL